MQVVAATSFWYGTRFVRKGQVCNSTDEVVAETPPEWWRSDDEQATARPGERRNVKRPHKKASE